MTIVTVNEAKHALDSLIEQVIADAEPMVITAENGQQIVLISLDEYNAWQETIYLLSNPANVAHLRQSIAQAQRGQVQVRELIDP